MRGLARRVIVLVGSAVVASVLTAAPTTAAPGHATQEPEQTRYVPTRPFVVDEPRDMVSDHTDPAWLSPRVAVPEATTAELDVPASGWATAGALPVAVGRAESGTPAGRVRVRMLSQDDVAALGGRFLAFEVTRADGGSSAGAVAVSIDYSGIAKAYGGNFASRLRLVRARPCPAAAPCRWASAGVNEGGRLRSASVAVRPDPSVAPGAPAPDSGFGPQTGDPEASSLLDASGGTTYMAVASASGANGDYSASQLSSADTWNVGMGSGAFTYSYPFDVPPAVAGPAPSLALNYNSQSVDGRTSASNGQVSKVGEGWSFEPGFIERKFHSCWDENVSRDDFCWSNANEYFISFLGQSGELVRTDSSSNEWRIRGNDPAWRILSFKACCANGDNDGEYFVVITPDGTKYWFGYGTEPRNTSSNPDTNSAWTVPVYASTSGEPCYNAVATASWCQQAYRWNVDRVLDTNDNVTTLFYAKETNKYSRHGQGALATTYTRSGYLTMIEYGQRHLAENVTASARVRFAMTNRCSSIETTDCATAPTSGSSQGTFPDVPLDLMCTGATCAADQTTPTFWSTKALKSISTEFWNAELAPDAYDPVTTYSMTYSFPGTGDESSPSLWLAAIEKTGEYGPGSVTLPGTRMSGIAPYPNRVNSTVNDPLNKFRVRTIRTDLGAQIDITYDRPHPCPLNTVFAADTNPYDCYPVWYDGAWIPFHKYVVGEVSTIDVRGGQPTRTTTYEYVGSPAWHYADSALAAVSTRASTQTWNDWRGYEGLRVRTANATTTTASSDSDTRYLVFRGMYGDKRSDGTTKTNQAVTDSFGSEWNDYDYRGGQVLETKGMDTDGTHLTSTVYRYWSQETVNGPNGFQSHDADYVRPSRVIRRVKNTDTGAWRDHYVDHEYSTVTGMPVSTSDDQDAGADDDTCVKTSYTTNTATGTAGGDSEWIVDTPYRTMTYSDPCGTGASAVQVGQTDTYYDGHATLTADPTDTNVTQVRAYSAAATTAVTVMTYDGLGRVTSVKAPGEVARGAAGKATTTTYAPSTGYPYDGIEVTTPTGAVTSMVLYSAFGTVRRVIDVSNDDTTRISVDPLGRTLYVNRPEEPPEKQSLEFSYRVALGLPNKVTTRTLVSDTAYVEQHDYVDGLGRTIQTHYPKANDSDSSRRVAITRYDPLGHVIARTDAFTPDTPVTDMVDVALADIPRETRYGYDALGRVYVETQYADGGAKIAHRTHHHGWHHTVDSPVRSDVDYHTDVFGRVTTVVETPAVGTITTTYDYTPTGQLDTITDDAGNVTGYDYDWLGRRTRSVDPDQGTWDTTYTADGDVKTVTDANTTGGVRDKVVYAYDAGRRKTGVFAGSETAANQLAGWTYDTGATNAVGRPVAATSYVDGTAYTVSVTGYDGRGRVTGKKWHVPGFGTASTADDTYTYTYGYTKDDELATVTVPEAGGLGLETVTTTRNGAGLPVGLTTSLDAANPYVAATTYRPDGQVSSRSLVGGVTRSYAYDSVARLSTTVSTAPVGGVPDATIEDVGYTYDSDGNVVSVRDAKASATTTSQRECFEYDPLNRLTRAYTTGTTCAESPTLTFGVDPYDLGYGYDDLGNIRQARDGAVTTDYTYTGSGHAHAPASIGSVAYGYDANGATTSRGSGGTAQQYSWDKLHRLKAVTGAGAATFVYDADGTRLLRTSGGTTTLYLDGMELASTAAGGTTTVAATRYYGGFAVRTASNAVHVLLRNRQNSSSVAYDTTADVATYQRYTPYGSRRGATPLALTDRRFLDKTEDASGLVAMGARYYDPGIGRFLSVDPLADLNAPQSLASYSYSLGNPATLADPSGLSAIDPDGAGGGPGCEHDCADPEITHQIIYDYTIESIAAGVPVEDEVFAAGNFSEQEREQLLWAMNTSPCSIATDRSACAGNSHFIFTCQMGGESDCVARGASAASAGAFMAAGVLTAAGIAGSKAANSAGSSFGTRGSDRWGAQTRLRLSRGLRTRLGDPSGERGALGSGPGLLTRKQAADMAKWSGFRPVGGWRIKGQQVYTDGSRYIVQDVDMHLRGAMWKMAESPRALLTKNTRMGTYDFEFNKLGP
ncbi:MAG TPA: RHS repeat-associated core domain-containing protein [Frankiaceae bacterium]|nr:RHS repeat-associated core domain-containing protein [Frankiaceae bacterium]